QSPRLPSFRSPLLHFLNPRGLHHRNARLFLIARDLATDRKPAREQRNDLIVECVQFFSPQLQLIHLNFCAFTLRSLPHRRRMKTVRTRGAGLLPSGESLPIPPPDLTAPRLLRRRLSSPH